MSSKLILTILAIVLLGISGCYYGELSPVKSDIDQKGDILLDALDREEYMSIPDRNRPWVLQDSFSFDREEYVLLVYNPSLSNFGDFSLECFNNPYASVRSYEIQEEREDYTVIKLYLDFEGSQGNDVCTLSILDEDQNTFFAIQEGVN
ncbi:MAG: hypothetical protein ACMXX9_01030 [Candidatus Woesearchaeota archaeon]